MNKAKRLIFGLMLAFFVAMICSTGLGIQLMSSAEEGGQVVSSFKPGASIRVDEVQDGVIGIRFVGQLNGEVYSRLIEGGKYKDGCEVGMCIVPEKLLQKFDNSGANDFFTWLKDNEKVEPADVSAVFPVEKIRATSDQADSYVINGVIDVFEKNYAYDYQAMSYYKENGTITYLGRSDARSISYVADAALVDENSDLTDIQKQLCASVISKTTDIKNKGTNGALDISITTLNACEQNLHDLYFPYITASDITYSLGESNAVAVNDGTLFAAKKGSATITVKAYGGLFSYTLNVEVGIEVTLESPVNEIGLFTPTTLSGGEAKGFEKNINDISFTLNSDDNQTKTIPASSLTLSVADDKATIANGKITAQKSGSTKLTAEYGALSTEIPVSVYSPINTAADLDALALSTYTKPLDEAEAYMAGWYKLTSDIDYAMHERNFILPIAPVMPIFNHWMGNTYGPKTQYVFASGYSYGTSSFYSIGWKNILGLSEGTAENGGKFLKNSDGTEFRGINPNGLHFTGIIDGNGYAIKNAWYMYDNYLGESIGANIGFIGINDGTVQNLEMNVTVPNWFTVYENGKYAYSTIGYNTAIGGNKVENCFAKMYHDAGTLLKADGETMETDYVHDHDSTERGGMVVLNAKGTVQNIRYNVEYRGRGDGNATAPTPIVCVNSSVLRNCVVKATFPGPDYSGMDIYMPTAVRYNIGLGDLVIGDGNAYLGCNKGTIENVYTVTEFKPGFVKADNTPVYDKKGDGTIDEKSSKIYEDAAAVRAAIVGFDETIWNLGDGTNLPSLIKHG